MALRHNAVTSPTVLPNLPKCGQATLGVRFLLHGHQFHARLSLRASAGGSTGVLTVRGTPGQLFEIDRGIQISIQHQPTLFTVKGPICEGQILIEPPTPTTPLAGWLPPIGQDHSGPIPAGFIEQLPLELVEPDIADGLRQMVVLQHPADVQVFDHQDRLGFRQPGGHLMQRVASLVLDLPMELGELADGFLAVLAALLPPAHHPLQPFELLQTPFEVARIGDHLAIGEGSQALDPQIDPHHRAGVLRHRLLFLHLQTHIPVPRLLAHRRREDLDPCGGQILRSLRRSRPRRGSTIAFPTPRSGR